MVSPRNYFLYTPLLPSAATGTVEPRSIVDPVRSHIPDTVSLPELAMLAPSVTHLLHMPPYPCKCNQTGQATVKQNLLVTWGIVEKHPENFGNGNIYL